MRTPTSRTILDKQQLVNDNLPYVRAIAARIRDQLPKEIEFGDLVAYGTQGLIEAAERYDGRSSTSFTTFAYYRVRGAIFDGLRGMGWLSRGEYSRSRFEERATAYLANLADREAGAEALGPPSDTGRAIEDEVRDLATALGGVAAVFVTALKLDDEQAMRDVSPHPAEQLEEREASGVLYRALASLPEKERRLIELYYFEEKTLEEAGAAIGLSKSWTSRLHARAIDLLKVQLERSAAAEEAGLPLPRLPRRRKRSSR